MPNLANIEMNDVKAAFKKVFQIGNRVYYNSKGKHPNTTVDGLFRSHFKGIASYNNKLIFTHTNLGELSNNGPGKIMIADKPNSGVQPSVNTIYDTAPYHAGWAHPCSVQACGSFMAMGIQDTAESNCKAEIHILDLTPLDAGKQPQKIGTIAHVNKTKGVAQPSAVNGVAMTKEHGDAGRYIVAGLQGNALTIYRSTKSVLTTNPTDNMFNVVGDTIQNFPISGAGIALITQTNGEIYLIALDADDKASNNRIYLCQLTITESTVTCSGVIDSKEMPVSGLSEAVGYIINPGIIGTLANLDSTFGRFTSFFSNTKEGIETLNASFRWGKGLAITSADTIEIYATDRNDLSTSSSNGSNNAFSMVTWTNALPTSAFYLTTQGDDGIYFINTNNPKDSQWRIPSTKGYGFRGFTAADNRLYLTTHGSDGIYIFDTKNITKEPWQIPTTAGYGFQDVITIGDLLYLTTQGSDGIFTFKRTPSFFGNYQKPSQIPSTSGLGFQGITAIGDTLYLTTQGRDGIYKFLRIAVFGNYRSPSQIPSTAGLKFNSVVAVGTRLYLTGIDGIYQFDTNNQTQAPTKIPSTAGYGFRNVTAVGDMLYLTTQGEDGIFKFNTQKTNEPPYRIPATENHGFWGIMPLI